MTEKLWSPSENDIKQTSLYHFIQAVNQNFGLSLQNYHDLHKWSINDKANFWEFLAKYVKFPFFSSYRHVVQFPDSIKKIKWFTESTTNYAKKIMDLSGNQLALIAYNEIGQKRFVTRDELIEEVSKSIAGLQQIGVKKNDVVVAYMPNIFETVVLFLACASLGIIWSSCSPDFGVESVYERFRQIKPVLLLTVDGYHYGGKYFNIQKKIDSLLELIPEINTVITVPYVSNSSHKSRNCYTWNEFITIGQAKEQPVCIPVAFDHPLYILYSSGTTGKPKCIVHGHGGSLIQHIKEHILHTDIKPTNRIFYFTTCGWMMWNWLISVLASDACIILYDGSPFYPNPSILWQITEDENIKVFGTSAKYISSLEKAKYYPKENHDLSKLKTILSTGSVLTHENFDFVYTKIKQNICLSSISGGTDIVSCFVLGNSILPVYRGQIQCLGLGMDVKFFNGQKEVSIGNKGELVCCQGFPSMPVFFWNDSNKEIYYRTYFSQYVDYWCHGDYGEITPEGGIILHGRSDTTLNPGGIRIGTAEIYRQVEKLDEIMESMAIGQKYANDERIVLFVILKNNKELTNELKNKICDTIRNNATARHVPTKIVQVLDFPRTTNGKISELAVKAIINHQPVKNINALSNADILHVYKKMIETQEI